MRPTRSRRAAGAVLAVLAVMAFGGTAQADTFQVSNLGDSGVGSLRQAITDANANTGADGIAFSPSLPVGMIELDSDLPTITEPLDIEGPGAGRLTVSGGGQHAIFSFQDSAGHFDATVFGLSLIDGSTPGSGAVINNQGAHVIVLDTSISDNHAVGPGGAIYSDYRVEVLHTDLIRNHSDASGGGVAAGGPDLGSSLPNLNVSNSPISDNSASGSGGGIDIFSGNAEIDGSTVDSNTAGAGGGGIEHDGAVMFLAFSTLAFNNANGSGGALQTHGELAAGHQNTLSDNFAGGSGGAVDAAGPFFYKQTTISDNSAANTGGGIFNEQILDAGPRTHSLYNSIVADNAAASSPDLGGFFDARFSLVENTSGATIIDAVHASNVFGLDPQLGPLTDNGGTTLTRALAPTSPAVDKGSDAFYPEDQRGFPRAQDLPGVTNSSATGADTYESSNTFVHADGSDIGSFELQPGPAPAVTALNPTHGAAAGGTSVTITGANLSSATAVKFGARNATSFTVNGATQITATAPAGTAGDTVDVTVSTAYGTSSTTGTGNDFTYDVQPTPVVTSLSPTHGAAAGGTSVTITGANLSSATAVKFGARNATSFTVNGATQITATAPAGTAGDTVDVTVSTTFGTSSTAGAADDYSYDAASTSGGGAPPAASLPNTNRFSFGSLRRNTRKGTAELTVEIPGPGIVLLTGKGLAAEMLVVKASQIAAGGGEERLLIRATGSARAKIDQSGKVRVKLKITFIPTGGEPFSKTRNLILKKPL